MTVRSVPFRVGLAAGLVVVLAAAGAARVMGSGSPTPQDRTSPAILRAVAAGEGITVEQARGRLIRQADLARLAGAVAPTLDRTRTAGLYIDQRAGDLVVGVTVPGASGPKRKDVREVLVRYSSYDLDRAAAAIAAAVAATGADGLTWGVDVRGNAVVVAVRATYARWPPTAALLARAAPLGPVVRPRIVKDVETTAAGTGHFEPVGDEVAAGDWAEGCSVAWPVRGRRGDDAILTAGHCVTGQTAFGVRAGRSIGRVVRHGHGPRDFGVIGLDPAGVVRLGDKVNLYDGSYARLVGRAPAPVGSVVCKSGAVSGLTCGTITAERISSVEGGTVLEDMVGIRTCSDYGDSGGAVFVPYADGRVTAQGIVSGGIEACHPAGDGDREVIDNGTRYQPVDVVLREQGLTLRVDGGD